MYCTSRRCCTVFTTFRRHCHLLPIWRHSRVSW